MSEDSQLDRKPAENTDKRNPDGTFARGNSGRPRGSRNRVAQTVERLLGDDIEQVTKAVLNKALRGDMIAAKIVLDRIAPPRRDRTFEIEIPRIETATDAARALGMIAQAMAAGAISPSEAKAASAIFITFSKTLEVAELEQRIVALEAVSK